MSTTLRTPSRPACTQNDVPPRVEVAEGFGRVESPAGVLRGRLAGPVTVGTAAVVAVRPENLAFVEGAGDGEPLMRGRVVLAQYLGNIVRYEVEVGAGTVLLVDVHDSRRHRPLGPGDKAAVGFAPTAALVFTRSGPTGR